MMMNLTVNKLFAKMYGVKQPFLNSNLTRHFESAILNPGHF